MHLNTSPIIFYCYFAFSHSLLRIFGYQMCLHIEELFLLPRVK